MTYEQRDNSGRLFKVEEDKKRDRGPDYSGTAMINGAEYYMDAWIKTAESGRKWMSFSFKQKQQRDTRTHAEQKRAPMARDDAARARQTRAPESFSDDVPF